MSLVSFGTVRGVLARADNMPAAIVFGGRRLWFLASGVWHDAGTWKDEVVW